MATVDPSATQAKLSLLFEDKTSAALAATDAKLAAWATSAETSFSKAAKGSENLLGSFNKLAVFFAAGMLLKATASWVTSLAEAASKSDDLNAKLGENTVASLRSFHGSMDRAKDALTKFGATIAVGFVGDLETAADRVAKWLNENEWVAEGISRTIYDVISGVSEGIGIVVGAGEAGMGYLESAAYNLGAAFSAMEALFAKAAAGIIESGSKAMQSLIDDVWNKLPLPVRLGLNLGGVNRPTFDTSSATGLLKGWSKAAADEGHRLLAKGDASRALADDAFVDTLSNWQRPEYDAVARKGIKFTPLARDEKEQAKAGADARNKEERLREQLEKEAQRVIEQARKQGMSELEVLDWKHWEELQKFQDFAEAREALEKIYQHRRSELLRQRNHEQIQLTAQGFAAMGQLMEAFHVGSFKTQQKFAIAEAVINTYAGVTQALRAFPPPKSWIMAAMTLAKGKQQIDAIRSATPGGGAASGSGGTGGDSGAGGASPPEIPTVAEDQRKQIHERHVTIQLVNVIGTREFVDTQVIPSLREAIDDHADLGRVTINGR